MNMQEKISIEDLYKLMLEDGVEILESKNEYEVLDVQYKGLKILTHGRRYVGLKFLSRHKTPKDLVEIVIESEQLAGDLFVEQKTKILNRVVVTTDHICMVMSRDKFFENVCAKNLKIGDYVSVYSESEDKEYIGVIALINNLGKTCEWVYDCEVDDGMHAFYADSVLVHNSQFVNLRCVTEHIAKKNGQDKLLCDWPEELKKELWDTVSEFVDTEVNGFVRDLVHEYCGTSLQNVLTYELEYMTSRGIWEGKKHYYIHKIFEDGDRVDKTKVTGIMLKKGETPAKLKDFLKECYEGVLDHYWSLRDYEDYISKLYEKFTKLSIDDIAYWRGYTAERTAVGFLQMQTGTTIAARAANYYNLIINKLGLTKKYTLIIVGNKIRYCYIEKSNPYGIDVIAYLPGQWPKEFDSIFKIDYAVMFDKMVTKQLARYREACKFSEFDPKKQVVQDIFDL